ncbi:MAG: aldo/keto reductase [Clostridia bacterium]|nr:aldo/keto reductase [Clostridia bacterium]
MQYRKMGKLGIEVSAFGIGCMRFPMVTNEEGKRVVDQELANKIIHTAIENGVNYLDTAYVYSDKQAEKVLGKALEGGWREKVYVATKLPIWDCHTPEDLPRLYEEQRTNLGVDCIDFYLVHALNRDAWHKMRDLGVREFLTDLKAQGKIKYACFSFHDNYEAFEEILNDYDWDMCQIQFNYMDVNNQATIKGVELAGEKNIPIVIMEGLLGGRLANVPDTVQAVFDSYPEKRSAVEWAFRWLCNFPQVGTVLSGVTNMEQTMDNLAIFDRTGVGIMSDEELAIVDKAREEYLRRTKVGCTGCRYCMPCPAGVDIPGVFGTWNEAFKYNTNISGNGRYRHMVGEGKGADQCVECGACMEMCPQQLNIPELLKQASAELS